MTEQTSDATALETVDYHGPTQPAMLILGLWAVAVIGSFLPWATLGFIQINGTAGDGQIVVIAGLIAMAMVGAIHFDKLSPGAYWVVLVLGVICACVGIYDWVNISGTADTDGGIFGDIKVSPGIGLILTTVASLGVVGVLGRPVVQRIFDR